MSFQQVKPKGWRKIGNFFDTADYANNQLIIKGYDIIKVSKSQKNNIIMFTSLSLWGLRIQMSNGYINYIIHERPHEYEKAYMTAIILSRMNKFINSIHSYEQYTISERSISRTINICKNKIKKSRMNAILEDLEHKFTMLGI